MSSFDNAILNVKNDFQILRYDCRGQGKSPKPESVYTLEDHVLDLKDLIEKLNLKNIILIGLSNGGRVVLEYATRFPVTAVVALDTYDSPTPLLKAKLSSWLEAHLKGGPLLRFDVATPWIWGEEVFNNRYELILSYREKASTTLDHVVKGLILGALQTDIDLTKISAPVLLVAGKEDLLTPVFNHEKMLAKLKNGELITVDGGHASVIERPMIFEKNILPWIKRFF